METGSAVDTVMGRVSMSKGVQKTARNNMQNYLPIVQFICTLSKTLPRHLMHCSSHDPWESLLSIVYL